MDRALMNNEYQKLNVMLKMLRITVSKVKSFLPVHEWLLLYNWYNKLNAVVKWNGSYSKMFCVTRGTRQGRCIC